MRSNKLQNLLLKVDYVSLFHCTIHNTASLFPLHQTESKSTSNNIKKLDVLPQESSLCVPVELGQF